MNRFVNIFLGLIFLSLAGCGSAKEGKNRPLKVAATLVPHAQLLEYVRPDLEKQGVDLQIIVTDDYNMPNRALAEGEIDANFFQHVPFLEEQIKHFHYPLVILTPVEIEPMGVYSYKYKTLGEIPVGARIAIPNDPTNEGRALLLLQQGGLIELSSKNQGQATPLDIVQNPKKLQFKEIDAALMPRVFQEVDAAAINTNYALVANLDPEKNSLILEGKSSPYVNVIVTTKAKESNPDLQLLKEKMTSPEMRAFIDETYQGAVEPAF